jgi:AraC-like DNA-binding protein
MEKFKKYERLKLSGTHLEVGEHFVPENHPQHWHNYFEIELILSGTGKYIINDVSYDIKERCVFISTPTDFHYLEIHDPVRLINVSFDEEALDESYVSRLFLSDMDRAFSLDADEYKRAFCALELLTHECAVGGDFQKELLEYLIKILFRKSERGKHRTENEHSKGIKNAIIYMGLHFKEQITLSDIASEAGYNPSYFTELFKKATGESCMEHLTRLRIGYSKMMLSSGFSVADSGSLSGFGSKSAFLEAFKRTVGIAPSEYRKKVPRG